MPTVDVGIFGSLPWYVELQRIRRQEKHVKSVCEKVEALKIDMSIEEEAAMGYEVRFVYALLTTHHALSPDHLSEWLSLLERCAAARSQFPQQLEDVFLSAISFLSRKDFWFEFDPPEFQDHPYFDELLEKLDIANTLLACEDIIREKLFPALPQIELERVQKVIDCATLINIDEFLHAWHSMNPGTMGADVKELFDIRSARGMHKQ